MGQAQVFKIDKFLGVNKSATETLLQLGEAASMKNWVITDDMKLQKMWGYTHLNEVTNQKVNGMWYGSLLGVSHYLYSKGGKVYSHNLTTHADTEIGTVANTHITFFSMNNTAYIMDGNELYKWAGTGNISVVVGYVPTVFTAAPPSGGGVILEALNYLTGKKKMKFSANGSATVYQLPEYSIESVDSVTINGVLKTAGVDYTVNLTNGTITTVSTVITGVNNVEVAWTKTEAGDRQIITNNRYYGGMYYAMLWLYGNPNHKNTRYRSGVTMAGVSDPTYWPKFTDSDIGEHEITAIATQYDKQLIWTSGDSNGAAWYSTNETYTDENSGLVTTLFPVYPMNAKIGHEAKGQVQIIQNNPFTLWKGVQEWESTYVLNEKNAKWISKRVQSDLDSVDLSNAITYDWDDKGWYLLCVGKKIWVYNYRVDAWYILEIEHTPTCFITIDGKLYFGTTGGQIMKFDETLGTYDGTAINAEWEMGYFNFDVEWMRKFIQTMFISILPLTQTHVDIYVSTDRNSSFQQIGTVSYSLSSFETWDFDTFSFQVNYSPQPFKRKLRAKKVGYLKLKLANDGTDGAMVLSISLPTRVGGEIKNRGA